jgi:hypothetical protein
VVVVLLVETVRLTMVVAAVAVRLGAIELVEQVILLQLPQRKVITVVTAASTAHLDNKVVAVVVVLVLTV